MSQSCHKKTNEKKFVIAFAGILFVVLFVIASLWYFFRDVTREQTANSQRQMEEFSIQSIEAVEKQITDSQIFLQGISDSLTYFGTLQPENVNQYLNNALNMSNFKKIYLLDLHGKGIDFREKSNYFAESQAFQAATQGESSIMVTLDYLAPDERMIFIFEPVKKEKQVVGVLCGMYDMKKFSQMLEMISFEGARYSYIMEGNGIYITKSSNQNALAKNYSLWADLRKAKFDDHYSLEQMREAIKQGKSGFLSYEIDGVKRCAYFAPININDWFMLSVIPRKVILSYTSKIQTMAFFLTIKVMGAVLLLLAVVFFHMSKSKKQLLDICNALKISEERFRIAASHTDNILFDYDLEKKTIYHSDPNVLRYGVNMVIKDLPESLIEKGVISSEYAKEFHQIFQDIMEGAPKASCVVKSNLCDHTYRWDKITLTNVFDEEGNPIRTIGIISDVTEQKEAEIRYVQEEQYRKAIRAKSILSYEFYLMKDEIINGNDCWNQYLKLADTNRYSCVMEYVLNHDIYSEDRSKVYETFSLSNLLGIYSQGQSNVELEYRRIKEDGNVVWVNCTMHLFRDLKNNEIKGFAYVKDIDKEKKEALRLKDKARRDSLTGLYNRAETERLVGEILQASKKKGVIHAFLIIDLDDFKGTNDQYGHIAGDAALNEIASKMKAIFRKTDIVGRLGGDEFVALLQDIEDFSEIEDKVCSLCNLQIDLSENQGGILEIFSTIGVAFAFEQGSTFMELYEKADKALYFAKNQGKARYACYKETLFPFEV